MKNYFRSVTLLVGAIVAAPIVTAADLVIYSTRDSSYIKPLVDQYSRDTGAQAFYSIGSHRALTKRMLVEGSRGAADIYLTASAANLWDASKKGLLAQVESSTLEDNIPAKLRAEDNRWFALSKRPRTIVYNTEKVLKSELSTYADLAYPKWRGRLCMRSGKDDYTQGMVALMLNRDGEETTKTVLQGWQNNLGYELLRDDMHVLQAMHQGACDVGIINTYYFSRFEMEQPDHSLQLFWADQGGEGVYVDVTGAGIATHSKNPDQAVDFLEWLSEKRQQSSYAKLSREYPVHEDVYPVREVAKWGRFEEDSQPVANAGKNHHQAVELIKEVNFQ